MPTITALKLHSLDNVAVCTRAVVESDTVEIILPDGSRSTLEARTPIAFCNKIALCDIAAGDEIRKYGEVIGKATADIVQGSLVNHTNIISQPRSYADEYIPEGD